MTEREWWPEGYDLPAFRVKRQTYGSMTGGDWVRGSSDGSLPHTALRYPSSTQLDESDLTKAQSLIFVRPFNYHTVEVFWGWPTTYPGWEEVALVRSSFGHPSTPRDGMVVFRAERGDERLPETGINQKGEEYPVGPPVIYDLALPGGRWYYYTLFFRMNAAEWLGVMSDGCALPADYKHSERMWDCVPPYYQWVDDNDYHHLKKFISVFGFAMDNTREFVEGVLDLHRIDKTPMQLLKGLGANYGLPYESGIGDIRYRSLVANAPNAQHTRGTAEGLRRLVEAVSKYQTEVSGTLTLMLFPDDSDFYLTTGNWGGLHPDAVAPLIAQDSTLTTAPWDTVFVARVDKQPKVGRGVMRVYTTKANETQNLIVAVGDSRIRNDPNTLIVRTDGAPIDAANPAPDTVPTSPPPTDSESGLVYRDAIPLETGITVVPGRPYGFSIWIQAPEKVAGSTPAFSIELRMVWTGASGNPQEVVGVTLGTITPAPLDGSWRQFIAQGIAPEATDEFPEAEYLIPMVRFSNRAVYSLTNRSAAIDICGVMVYGLGDEDSKVSVTPPDAYLTLGDPNEKIGSPGVPGAPPTFEGSPMGSPPKGSQRGT